MKCPICNSYFDAIEFFILGQAMCPVCGEIVDLENDAELNDYDNNDDSLYEEENDDEIF